MFPFSKYYLEKIYFPWEIEFLYVATVIFIS